MDKSSEEAGYNANYVQAFEFYLQQSEEHKAICAFMDKVLPDEFTRIGEGKSSFNVLGVGSGGGEMDAHMLHILQSRLPATPVSVDVVEPSKKLIDNFKALVARTPSLQKIPFTWNAIACGEYEKQVKGNKRFDFIHMIQMLYYVDDYVATIKFFQGLLRENGRLLIIHEGGGSGWATLWKTYKKELCTRSISNYISASDIKDQLKALGLKFEEHLAPNTLDMTDCFTEGSKKGQLLLDFMTDQNFHTTMTPETRAGVLDLLRNKCSTVKNGRILFDCGLSCLVVHT
ncbi:histamine N-methyltransferase isoform X2 [Chanos chanos]|uniref:Histamine N-methyltransferase isoform X2 n=1 Tax=Chanos chanos TaxID=29144 RepID=A0A6J2W8G3_CHACN|nr:histamine N-methyltransferase-like isoform X2 [Chanos chanos]